MKSLAKQSLDTLVETLLSELNAHVRVIAPGAPFTVLDSYYVGNLKQLLLEKYPGVPDSVFHQLRDDLIVVERNLSAPSRALTRFEPAILRVNKDVVTNQTRDELQEIYESLTNVTVKRHRYLPPDLPDLTGVALHFSPHFFSPKSFDRWQKVTQELARQVAAYAELKKKVGLSQKNVANEGVDHTLVQAIHED